ncbi:hypothetical protein TELCIR_16437, partial [Teladorsagia circumcincta]
QSIHSQAPKYRNMPAESFSQMNDLPFQEFVNKLRNNKNECKNSGDFRIRMPYFLKFKPEECFTKRVHSIREKDATRKHMQFALMVDPCEDFYRFACGKWEANTPEVPSSYEQITPLSKLNDKYERTQR